MKLWKRLVLCCIPILLLLSAGCSNFTAIGNKVYQNRYGNLTPAINSTFYVGDDNHYWSYGYFDNLRVGTLIATANTSIVSNASYASVAGYAGSAGTATYTPSAGNANTALYAMVADVCNTLPDPERVFTVAKSGANYTSIQTAINDAAVYANSTHPQLVMIAPGVYNESIVFAPYVNLSTLSGVSKDVIIEQNDNDVAALNGGVVNVNGITFRIVSPTQARTVVKDNGVESTCFMVNCATYITNPSSYDHVAIDVSGNNTYFIMYSFDLAIGSTGSAIGIDVSSNSTFLCESSGIHIESPNGYNVRCTHPSAEIDISNTMVDGTSSLFYTTGGTVRWSSCKMDSTGTINVNTDALHYMENSYISVNVIAGNGAEVRLSECSYPYIERTGTGNIIDTSRKLQSGIYHVVDYTWNTSIAYANVYVRKSGTGDIQTGGSGQGVAGVRMNSVSYAGVENNVDITGGLNSSFNCARTIKMHQTVSINQFHANGHMFIGVRETLGNAIPTVGGAENYAGFIWDGTNCRVESSNGGGVGQSTIITSPTINQQYSIEIQIYGSKRVDFYCNGVLVGSHSTANGIPSGYVDWQRLMVSDGGGDSSYMYMTLRNGYIVECPQ